MTNARCSDCGAPAIGTFDVAERPDGDLSKLSASDKSQWDRPLCSVHAGSRPRATPTETKKAGD